MRSVSEPASGQPVTVVVGIAVDSTTGERAQNFMASLTALRRQTLPRSDYRVVVLHNGEVVEGGPPSEVLVNPQHEATQRLLQVERSTKP